MLRLTSRRLILLPTAGFSVLGVLRSQPAAKNIVDVGYSTLVSAGFFCL